MPDALFNMEDEPPRGLGRNEDTDLLRNPYNTNSKGRDRLTGRIRIVAPSASECLN